MHDVVTGGQDTVAIRVPSHPMAQQLLTAFGGGIAAPSANRYGRLSPTRAEHVREELGEQVKVILDGGECQIGLESTIIAFQGQGVRLLRPGAITAAQIRQVVGELLIGADVESPRVPGGTPSHYAPTTPMTIVPSGEIDARAAGALRGRPPRGRAGAAAAAQGPQVRHLDQCGPPPGAVRARSLQQPADARQAGCQRILVQDVPEGERWIAIRDRLVRAAASVSDIDDSGTMAVLP